MHRIRLKFSTKLNLSLIVCILIGLTEAQLWAQSVQAPAADNSVKAQLKSFQIADGYEVNLFADETDGVANPICMRWDPAGRLWVLCTWAYPQPKATNKPNDKLLILQDTDGDGRADKITVFVDDLNMPTGFALGDGGVYIGQASDLLHLKDTNGDGKADTRKVLLTGFGTGDTHQNINSLTWSPGGELFFCQGLHAFARVETPWGIVRLNEHGVWRFRPRRLQLHTFPGGSGQNPWGIAFGRWGEPFVKGNNSEISELLPVMVHTSQRHAPLNIGKTNIKSMIAEIIDSPHLPDDIQGDVLIAGYFGHIIDRLKIETDGAGHKMKLVAPLLRSSHNSFRPVDIQTGPDGAIYIADWFNPIIGHYQASFRHPNRDKVHGRIWRVTAKGRSLAKVPALAKMSAAQLCEQLESKHHWVAVQAKRRLADLPTDQTIDSLNTWLSKLDKSDPNYEHHLYDAIGLFESHEVVNRPLLDLLIVAKDYRARAYAARVVGRWHDRIESPLALLDRLVVDESSRVRLEAVVAASDISTPQAMVVAAKASSRPMDRFIAAALKQCIHALASNWLPALQAGKLQFAQPQQLVYVLRSYGGKDVAGQTRHLLQNESISKDGRRQLLELLARVGNSADLRLVFKAAIKDTKLLSALARIGELRRIRPTGDVHTALISLLENKDPRVVAAAVRLAGHWKQQPLAAAVKALVNNDTINANVRAAAIRSLGDLSPAQAVAAARPFITSKQTEVVRLAALEVLCRQNLDAAMADGLKLLGQMESTDQMAPILVMLMQRKGAAKAMTAAIPKAKLKADDAKLIIRWLNAAGYGDAQLMIVLQEAMGVEPGKSTPYSPALIKTLAAKVRASGDAKAGRKVFESSVTGCVACHRVQELNQSLGSFPKGPELTAVGAGLPIEIIIESVIWPKRQIKEGYEATMLLLDDGRSINGYVVSQDNQVTLVRDLASGKTLPLPNASIIQRTKIGTLMPEGLTAFLTENELRDLIAYLTKLKGLQTGK